MNFGRRINATPAQISKQILPQQNEDEKFYREFYIYSTSFLTLPAGTPGANNSFTPNEIHIDSDSAFEFIKTIHRVTISATPATNIIAPANQFRLKYIDDAAGRNLMKASEYGTTISSTATALTLPNGAIIDNAFMPFIWPRPYVIGASTTLSVLAADDSGIAYNLYLSFHGNKVRPGIAPWKRKKYKSFMPYVYPIANVSNTSNPIAGTLIVAANNTVSSPIATDIDSDFLVLKITGRRTGGALVTIKDGNDRQWMDSPMHIDNLIGNGAFPNILPAPRFIERGSVISAMIQDISNVSNTIEMQFIGLKLYE